MPANSQSQSSFVNHLPREIRNAIYLELWRSCGLRQHITLHGYNPDLHYCRWQCVKEFEVQDGLQQDIGELTTKLRIPLVQEIDRDQDEKATLYCRRLQSPWMDHWPCGERAFDKYGIGAVWGPTTSMLKCWMGNGAERQSGSWPSPYIPMLLSCKIISAECLQSIYESTTFIFTDFRALQMFFGYCELPPALKKWPEKATPPAFFEYTRSLELSLSPDFPKHLACANMDLPGIDCRHEVYDFHWLRLGQFENLKRINIWIASRSVSCRVDSDNNFRGIKEINHQELTKLLTLFESIKSFTMSTPLGPSVGPEEGFVEGVVPMGSKLYKRGSGDKFHPFLTPIDIGHGLDGLIFTSPTGEVRLARNGGYYDLMRGF